MWCFRLALRSTRIETARAMMMTFLMMYWPVKVGTPKLCQVDSGRMKRGRMVASIWGIRRVIATRSILGMTKRMPMAISKRPRKTKKEGKFQKGIVTSKSSWTIVSAGLVPITFRKPNQTKTMKMEMCAKIKAARSYLV